MSDRFSLARFRALLIKEFIQVFRDRITFAMMVGIPLMQLCLFGYAINSDPRRLPAAVVAADHGPAARAIIRAMENSDYFAVTQQPRTLAEAERLIARGTVQFIISFPEDFQRRMERGEHPVVLIEADATDPVATANAISALARINRTALANDLTGPLAALAPVDPPFELRVHTRYNPEGASEYNIVPGLTGTILTLTLVMMTAVAMTKERERGTLEGLLSTPARPTEVMLGKIAPFIVIGMVQVCVILGVGRLLFGVPMLGSFSALGVVLFLFIATNLSVGFTFSTLASSQLQAMQMSTFFFLPSLLLSGFLFPFRGMPGWAQAIGEVFPLTHFLRAVRGILLKGNGFAEIWPNIWPLVLILALASLVAIRRYRQTLD